MKAHYPSILTLTILLSSSAWLNPLFAENSKNRYIKTHTIDIGENLIAGAPCPGGRSKTFPPLVRFVEGIDPDVRVFTPEELKQEIRDPFGPLLAGAVCGVPETVDEVLALLGPPGISGTALPRQTSYVVSATGQITVEEEPELERHPRGVVFRTNSGGSKAVFVATSFREQSVLEVLGWDENKALFNYYERRFVNGDEEQAVWVWKGDSSQAWNHQTRDFACFQCHRSGEVNMKELRVPWQNWHSQSATIKQDSIPEDSPLRTSEVFSIDPRSPFLRSGDELEKVVIPWIGKTNTTKLERYMNGDLSVYFILEPFFRTTTGVLTSSTELSNVGGNAPIIVPRSLFIDQRGLIDVGELFCDAFLSPPNLNIQRSAYHTALGDLNFRMEDPGNYLESPGDTHFALLTNEVPRVDYDLIQEIKMRQVLTRKMVTNLMLIDFVNPVYSPIRAYIFDILQQEFNPAPKDLEDELISFFQSLSEKNLPDVVRAEVQAFLERGKISEPTAFTDHACHAIDSYMGEITTQLEAGDFRQYMKLIASRYMDFANSDHQSLIESELLLPKTDPFSGLVMRQDGTVGPSSLADQITTH